MARDYARHGYWGQRVNLTVRRYTYFRHTLQVDSSPWMSPQCAGPVLSTTSYSISQCGESRGTSYPRLICCWDGCTSTRRRLSRSSRDSPHELSGG
jgi:hypothetical protein